MKEANLTKAEKEQLKKNFPGGAWKGIRGVGTKPLGTAKGK